MCLKLKLTGDLHLIPGLSLKDAAIMYVIHIYFAQQLHPYFFNAMYHWFGIVHLCKLQLCFTPCPSSHLSFSFIICKYKFDASF